MVKLTVNHQEIEVEEGSTVLQACEKLDIEVPTFCYHSKLSIAGNCRMCLVEMEKSPKLIASCAMPASEGMVIHTHTEKVQKARRGILELLLINHPLDCPICDQGGECDLQDLTFNYGPNASRFDFNKRIVAEKYMGPLIKTIMTRCIHCTRCVRFANEIAGVPEMGALYRGEHTEITSYLEKALSSELSGNMVDICPVGALTNKPYAFKGRSWELEKTETIDILDALGSHIRVDTNGSQVMRVLPRLCEEINEEWISDKTRYSYDGLSYQRLDRPYIRKNGKLQPCSWEEVFSFIADTLNNVPGDEIAALVGDLADSESILALKDLMIKLESPHLDCRQDGTCHDSNNRSSYLFNTTIERIEESDLAFLIGTNPRHEAAVLNARIRKRYLIGDYPISLIGNKVDLTYPYDYLGEHARVLKELLEETHPFSEKLKKAKKPLMILGQAVFMRRDSLVILDLCQQICEKYGFIQDHWNGFNVLHTAAARVGGLDLGFVPQKGGLALNEILSACQTGKIKVVYLLGADELPMDQLGSAFVIYQGHHGDGGSHRADVILPGAAYTEKHGTYVNTEGRPQRAFPCVALPGEAKEDWKIIRALSEYLGKKLPYDTLDEIREHLVKANPIFAEIGRIVTSPWKRIEVAVPESLSQLPFKNLIDIYYMTNPISRHSKIMAQCVKDILYRQRGVA